MQRWAPFFIAAMLIAAVSMPSHAQQIRTVPQYGLYQERFLIDEARYDDPYDAADIAVDATIALPNGETSTTPCFYDGEKGWKMRFTPSQDGEHSFAIVAQTPEETWTVREGQFRAQAQHDPGFVRIGRSKRFFVFENGESYFPLGQNLGWVHEGDPNLWTRYLEECQEAQINWIRIWMCPWGNTELTWTPRGGRYHGLDGYELENARLWDHIVRQAEQRGIYIQWVIHHHGQYSEGHNPEWQNNPYNVANGGFLEEPVEFFTNERAKHEYRNRLRYIVARWGYSTHVMAWEFWNEIDLTTGWTPEINEAWHEEMSAFLRELDPYNHLQTSSTSRDYPDMAQVEGLDFSQTHAYVTNIIDYQQMISHRYAQEYPQQPHFFGEMSYNYRGPNRDDEEGVILHNQLWSSVHSADSGTAMTWWWDNWVRPYDLYYHFDALAEYVKGIDWNQEQLQPLETTVSHHPNNTAPLVYTPPIGWGHTDQDTFEIDPSEGVVNGDRGTLFIHGRNHEEMAPNPVFVINNQEPAQFGIELARIAAAGAILEVRVNDEVAYRKAFAAAPNDTTINDASDIVINLPAGPNRVHVRNRGQDWIEVRHYWVEGYAQRPLAFARGNRNLALVWVQDRTHRFAQLDDYENNGPLQPVPIQIPSLREGEFSITQYDPYTGEASPLGNVDAGGEGLTFTLPAFERDVAFRIERISSGI